MKPLVAQAGPEALTATLLRYASSVAAVGCAVAVSVALGPYLSQTVFVLLWPAVIFAAWFSGLGPAVVSSVLGALAIDYFLVAPVGELFPRTPIALMQVAVFTLASFVISRLAAGARVAQVELRDANAELARANTSLQDQAAELEQTVEEAQALNEELEASNEQLQVAEESASTAQNRLSFLARASEVLASSLDYETTLRRVADLAIERIADWCVVEINAASGERVSRAVAHRDPNRVRWADEIDRRYPPDPHEDSGSARVLRSGRSELYSNISDEMLVGAARDAEHLRLLREIGFHAVIVVPIQARERVLGTLSFVSAESARVYTDEDLTLAEDLGRRAGTAVENAELLREAERAGDRARRLERFASALNVAATSEAVAEAAVVHGFDALGADSGSLALLSDDGTMFQVVHAHGYNSSVVARWNRFPMTPGRPLSDAVASGEPLILASRAEMAERVPTMALALEEARAAALVAVPLFAGGRPLGGLSYSFSTEQRFGEGVQAFLLTLGAQTAQALERARLLDAEQEARASAETANRAKSEFLSAMSHELRTPLNAIGGYAELLEMGIRGPVTDAQRGDLERIRRAQQHLLGLVNDILNFARIEAGRIDYHIAPVEVGPLIREMHDLIETQVGEKKLSFECRACSSDLVVLGDGERIRQILLNLLGNAVKFTAAGTVRVDAEDGEMVRIMVSDTGPGIPDDMREGIFDPFVQLGRGLNPEPHAGIGLGLAISRELAVGMSGTLTVDSRPGEGSTFTLSLPRASQGISADPREATGSPDE
jgi:signal transduction histidine kinase